MSAPGSTRGWLLQWGRRGPDRRRGAPPSPAVPDRRGAPVIGVALQLRQDPLQVLLARAHRGGNIVYLGRYPRRLYLINHPRYIQHILLDQPHHYVKRPSINRITPLFGTGLTTSDGALWQRQRRLLQPLGQSQRLLALVPVMTAATTAMLERWHRVAARGQPLEIAAEMSTLTQTMIFHMLFGSCAPGEGATVSAALQVALAYLNRRIWARVALPVALPTPRHWAWRQAMHTLHTFLHQQIVARCQTGQDTGDLLALLMTLRDDETGEAMSEAQLQDEILTLWVAGHTTTAAALAWTWVLVAQHPAIERRLCEEVRHTSEEGLPTAHPLQLLPYTRLVHAEVLRLYPPTWVTARTPLVADTLGGVPIPAGAVLLLCPYTMHRHPAFWETPESCDPERFLPARSTGRPRYAYFPFGGGPRRCLGQGLALLMMQVVTSLVARTYRLRLVSGQHVRPEAALTLQPARGLLFHVDPYV
jgi:cytochrome P450